MTKIAGIGADVVEVGRIAGLLERHGERFVARITRPEEVRRAPDSPVYAEHVSGLFAAKEAVLKALGTGWSQGLAPRDVEVSRMAEGGPSVRLHGRAHELAARRGIVAIHLSITHERSVAVAFAVLEMTEGV